MPDISRTASLTANVQLGYIRLRMKTARNCYYIESSVLGCLYKTEIKHGSVAVSEWIACCISDQRDMGKITENAQNGDTERYTSSNLETRADTKRHLRNLPY